MIWHALDETSDLKFVDIFQVLLNVISKYTFLITPCSKGCFIDLLLEVFCSIYLLELAKTSGGQIWDICRCIYKYFSSALRLKVICDRSMTSFKWGRNFKLGRILKFLQNRSVTLRKYVIFLFLYPLWYMKKCVKGHYIVFLPKSYTI